MLFSCTDFFIGNYQSKFYNTKLFRQELDSFFKSTSMIIVIMVSRFRVVTLSKLVPSQ